MTKKFNFDDLPCPPSGLADHLEKGQQYNPLLVAPRGCWTRYNIYKTSREKALCQVAAIRDHPTRAIRVGDITGRGDDIGGIIP